jgi:hypothetical protein
MGKIPYIDDTTPEFEELTPQDQVVQIFKKVKCTVLRMKVMAFAHSYRKPCEDLIKQGQIMHDFFSTIKKNPNLRRWLEYILTIGNYMNGQGHYGGAWGFKIDTFKKICEVKTADDSKNLLDYMIETIGRNEKDREILDFYLDLKDLENGK